MSRPKFLVGGVAFHALGVVMALSAGAGIDWRLVVLGQVFVTAAQLMTHHANEYFDRAADLANPHPTRWSGGSRVLVEGVLPPRVALATAGFTGALAVAAAALIALHSGPRIVALLAATLVLGWGYSCPPLRLESRGLGEIAIAVVTPGLVPLIGYTLHSGRLDAVALVTVAPLVVLAFGTTFAIHFPDADGDTISGKKTLVVRLGAARASRLAAASILAGCAGFGLLPRAGVPLLPAMLPLAAAPLGGWLVVRLLRGDGVHSRAWDSLNFWSAGLLMMAAGLQGLGFLVA